MSGRPVLHLVYSLIRGGTEGQCARVAMGLRGRGEDHRVAVFAREGFFLDAVERTCGPVAGVGIRRVVSARTAREVLRLARRLRREGVGLLHAWDADAAVFGALAAAWAGVPLATSHRDLGQIYPRWKRRAMGWADRRARAVVINAAAIRPAAVAMGAPAERIRLMPNLVDLEEFDALAAAPFPRADDLPPRPRVVMVSRLDPEKDGATVVRAAARVFARRAGSLVVAGAGREGPELERLAAGLLPAGRCVFLGEVAEVPALLREADVGVLAPRANEGLSNTLLEYMAAGLPVAATDCGGNAELVRDGVSGRLVPVGDADALAGALDDLLADPDRARAMGRAGRSRVEREHGREHVLDRFSDLYRELLGGV